VVKNIFRVHCEDASMQALAEGLEDEGFTVTIPEMEVSYTL